MRNLDHSNIQKEKHLICLTKVFKRIVQKKLWFEAKATEPFEHFHIVKYQ